VLIQVWGFLNQITGGKAAIQEGKLFGEYF
jgi:hypothetical protein